MSGNMKLLWVALSAVACAFPETELRGGVAPVSASEEAGTLIAARTSEAWLEELKDLIVGFPSGGFFMSPKKFWKNFKKHLTNTKKCDIVIKSFDNGKAIIF